MHYSIYYLMHTNHGLNRYNNLYKKHKPDFQTSIAVTLMYLHLFNSHIEFEIFLKRKQNSSYIFL